MMGSRNRPLSATLLSALLMLLVASCRGTSLHGRHLWPRQTDVEKESTTPQPVQSLNKFPAQQTGPQQPARLYPDISATGFMPIQPLQTAAGNNGGYQLPPMMPGFAQPSTPYLPFGPQMAPVGFQSQPRLPAARQISPAERQQSLTFTNGLGKRLLAMIGVETGEDPKETRSETDDKQGGATAKPTISSLNEVMKALQNSSVLVKLNGGVQSIYSGLSKMYNSTVQEQLQLLQDRYRKEIENSTNPWQQRVAQQVPMFFKNMAVRIEGAQDHLNKLWQQMGKASNRSSSPTDEGVNESRSTFFDQIVPHNFFNDPFGSIDRQSLPGDPSNIGDSKQPDLGARLMQFWHQQVQPQVGALRSQISRAWRDLTSSGAFQPQFVSRTNTGNNLGQPKGDGKSDQSESASNLAEDMLKLIDINNSEYTLVQPTNVEDGKQTERSGPDGFSLNSPNSNNKPIPGSLAIQNGLMNAQRELNQLWMGLTKSIQNAMSNVRQTVNPRPLFSDPMSPANSARANTETADPAENEIESKIKNIDKLQREADTVHDVVNQQQLRPHTGFGDRFRNMFNSVDLSRVEDFPRQVGESVNRLGNVLGDLWNQIPERWENFMQNHRMGHNNQDALFNRNLITNSRANSNKDPNSGSTTTSTTTTSPTSES